jgi:hypothetical protein
MAVNPFERGIVTLEFPNDLKPLSSILDMWGTFSTLGFFHPAPQGQPPKAVNNFFYPFKFLLFTLILSDDAPGQ